MKWSNLSKAQIDALWLLLALVVLLALWLLTHYTQTITTYHNP